jgi:hypothetical protein
VLLCTFVCGFITSTYAGLRGPGEYSGVVIFDRWDTCFLLSGPYITYVSEKVKDELRPYKGTAMQVHASQVWQPGNPGDAIIRKYTIVGPAPATHRWIVLKGLELIARADFSSKGEPAFWMEIHNEGTSDIAIDNSEVGPVLLTPVPKAIFNTPSDGRSLAVITRINLTPYDDLPQGPFMYWKFGDAEYTVSYTLDPKTLPPVRVQLKPGESMKARITFKVVPGQYQFLFGYGGGVHEEESLASNTISFDVDENGVATLVE